MTTFIKAELKKSDDQKNINKYRVDSNITEYHIISKLILKFMMIRQLFHINIYVKISKINNFKIKVWTFLS